MKRKGCGNLPNIEPVFLSMRTYGRYSQQDPIELQWPRPRKVFHLLFLRCCRQLKPFEMLTPNFFVNYLHNSLYFFVPFDLNTESFEASSKYAIGMKNARAFFSLLNHPIFLFVHIHLLGIDSRTEVRGFVAYFASRFFSFVWTNEPQFFLVTLFFSLTIEATGASAIRILQECPLLYKCFLVNVCMYTFSGIVHGVAVAPFGIPLYNSTPRVLISMFLSLYIASPLT